MYSHSSVALSITLERLQQQGPHGCDHIRYVVKTRETNKWMCAHLKLSLSTPATTKMGLLRQLTASKYPLWTLAIVLVMLDFVQLRMNTNHYSMHSTKFRDERSLITVLLYDVQSSHK